MSQQIRGLPPKSVATISGWFCANIYSWTPPHLHKWPLHCDWEMRRKISTKDAEELRKQLEQLCPAAHDVLIEERSFYLAQQVGCGGRVYPWHEKTQKVVVVVAAAAVVLVVNKSPFKQPRYFLQRCWVVFETCFQHFVWRAKKNRSQNLIGNPQCGKPHVFADFGGWKNTFCNLT